MQLKVEVIEAKDLRATDLGKCDPYVTLEIDGVEEKQETQVINNELNPTWNETFTFDITDINTTKLKITVLDKDPGRDDVVGTAEISNFGSRKVNSEIDEWIDLSLDLKLAELGGGKLHLKLTVVDPTQMPNSEEEQKAETEQPAQEGEQTQQDENQDNEEEQTKQEEEEKTEEELNHEQKIKYLQERIDQHHQRLSALKNGQQPPAIKTKSASKIPASPSAKAQKAQNSPQKSPRTSPKKSAKSTPKTGSEEETQNEPPESESQQDENIQEEVKEIKEKCRKQYNQVLKKFETISNNQKELDQQKRQREHDEGENLEEMSVDKLSSIYKRMKKESIDLDKRIADLNQQLRE